MTTTCARCEGHGHIKAFTHVQGGICFKCAGAGQVACTPKRAPRKANAAKEAARIARMAERDRKIAAAMTRYTNDSRMRWAHYGASHYAEVDAQALAEQDGVWATL